jgi:hypothetical protein
MLSEQREQRCHFFPALLPVTEVVDDQGIECG